jgi:exopolyphosphatase/guanosine-5'-triphosphate,3'-diphosphate pyrophosphatase
MRITRLGQGVDQSGLLAEVAMQRTLAVLADYATLLAQHRVKRLRATATSAARDAVNRADFFARVANVLGQEPELLSGEDEAKLSFVGATAGQSHELAPFLIFDIGGGSTEFALGVTEPTAFISVDMGGVRMTERFFHSDPPSPQQLAACKAFVTNELARVAERIPTQQARSWIGLAGTVTSAAAFTLGLKEYDAKQTHGHVLTRAAAHTFFSQLAGISSVERRKLLLEPKRAEVIVGGALVLGCVYEHFEVPSVIVSETDILDGLAASLRDS